MGGTGVKSVTPSFLDRVPGWVGHPSSGPVEPDSQPNRRFGGPRLLVVVGPLSFHDLSAGTDPAISIAFRPR
jgi:hypothetical protein